MVGKKRTCYFGCSTDGPLHGFPRWEDFRAERFNQWIAVLSIETQKRGNEYIFNNINLCCKHFEDKYQLPTKRLTLNAVPTINIPPLRPDSPEKLEVKSRIQDSTNILLAQLKAVRVPPTSELEDTADRTVSSIGSGSDQPCTSGSQETPDKALLPCYNAKQKILKLQTELKILRAKYKKVLKQNKLLMKRNTAGNTPREIFLQLQRKAMIKPRGRRFTAKEISMALRLRKESPQGYQLLKQLFVMPSIRTLRRNKLRNS